MLAGGCFIKAPFQLQNCNFYLPNIKTKRLYFLICQELK